MTYSTPGFLMMSWRPGFVEPRDVEAHAAASARDGVAVERALGHRDAQRPPAGRNRGFAGRRLTVRRSTKVSEGFPGARDRGDAGGEAYFGTRASGSAARSGAGGSRSVGRFRRLISRRNRRGGGHGLLEEEREAGGGAALAVGGYHVVVAAAAAERGAEPRGVRLEHEARIVVERAHDREVHEDALAQARFLQQVVRAGEGIEAVLAAERRHERAHLVDGRAPAADARQRRGWRPRTRAAPKRAHPAPRPERGRRPRAPSGGRAPRSSTRGRRRAPAPSTMRARPLASSSARSTPTVASASVQPRAPASVERLGEQAHDLGVGLGALLADALDAHLRELARLRLHLPPRPRGTRAAGSGS